MLSIIIPTLNEEQHLEKLIHQLEAQKSLSFEIIVSDGGSADATLKIAKNMGYPKIAIISGTGVRNYYRKLGYDLVDTYMVKTF